ncbi:MAG: hypothetical protein J6A59_01785 [Lachnospiraceae bacterium]|nr:hypothetical protein [Lachnospiraceae bacterium]
MKKMVFIREEGTQRLVAEVKEVGAVHEDGCCINIKNSVYKEAMKLGLVDEYVVGGKRTVTQFYRFGEITLLTIECAYTTVFDSYINDGTWIGEVLKNSGIVYHYSNGKKEQKHKVRISLPDVMRVNRDGVTKRGSHGVALNKFLWDIKKGKAGNPTDLYVYDGKESHHEKACWDNRIESTLNLSADEHREHHKILKEINPGSHQAIVNINTIEELEAFLEYLRNN